MDLSLLFSGLGWIAFICLLAGLACVIVEMFHPGFGAPGIAGSILLLAGVLLYARTLVQALIMVIIIIAILGIALTIVLQSASKGHLAKHLVLHDSLDESEGFSNPGDLEYFIGSEGVALTVLRPAGTADFSGVKLDVVSEGDFIPKDTAVKITKVEGHRIVVKKIS
jgi:membrane-bound ClpP family serine protease